MSRLKGLRAYKNSCEYHIDKMRRKARLGGGYIVRMSPSNIMAAYFPNFNCS